MVVSNLKVSVCVPAFNRAHYIGDTIRSVLAQTLRSFELVIYDDASTDDTGEVVAAFGDDRIRYYRQPHNVGIAQNRTACVGVARGEYIAWLDADDLYYPNALETQSGVLDHNPNVGLVHGAYDVIDQAGRKLPDWPQPFNESTVEPSRKALGELLLSNYICAPTVMVRQHCQAQIGPYSRRLRDHSEDWEMWMRMAARADVAYIARRIAQYRFHDNSASAAAVLSGRRLHADITAVRHFLSRSDVEFPEKASLHRRAMAALAAKALMQAGDAFTLARRSDALRAATMALRLFPRLLVGSGGLFLLDILRGNEHGSYRHSKQALQRLVLELDDSRFGRRLAKIARTDPDWEQSLTDISKTVSRLVPQSARIAVVDKWDPTILHLSRRKGWHFPDRSLLPAGYPLDSQEAVRHLELLVRRGAGYLVFPSASFWWLEFYRELGEHLDSRHQRIWADSDCIIYQLNTPVAE
jgi:glycosyltransferase involved in cell wall biosynthesis